ncbi:MAG: hypothetical protein ABSA86_07330 [Oryzomonas sp.]|jgi:hypothetical protein
MSAKRVQIAYHFQVDPAQMTAGMVRLPEQITRTVSVGEEFTTEKVGSDCLSFDDRGRLVAAIEKECLEANRTARPVAAGESAKAKPAANLAEQGDSEEMSAF